MAATLGNAIGAVGGYMKYKDGKNMISDAQHKIDNFQWKDLNNPFKTMKVSTLGADLQKEENEKLNATAVAAMQGAGTRGVIGGVNSLVEGSNDVNRKIAASLDEQQKNIDTLAAQDDTNIRGMEEKRQTDELSGYGQMLNIGRQEKYGGIADMMNAGQAQGQEMTSKASMITSMMGGKMGGGSMPQLSGKYNDKSAYAAQYYGQQTA